MSDRLAAATVPSMPWRGHLGALRGAIGAGLAIALVGLVSQGLPGTDQGLPWLVASMGASAVLAFVLPASPLAQPWPIFGSHILAAAIGLGCHALMPVPWAAAGLAVGLSIAAMRLLRCLHPPAGGTAVLTALATPAIAALSWQFLVFPLGLNLVLLISSAAMFNRLTGHPYPHHVQPAQPSVKAYDPADLDAVLAEWDEVLSIERDELDALMHAVIARHTRRA